MPSSASGLSQLTWLKEGAQLGWGHTCSLGPGVFHAYEAHYGPYMSCSHATQAPGAKATRTF